jgi:hypothetical protein
VPILGREFYEIFKIQPKLGQKAPLGPKIEKVSKYYKNIGIHVTPSIETLATNVGT